MSLTHQHIQRFNVTGNLLVLTPDIYVVDDSKMCKISKGKRTRITLAGFPNSMNIDIIYIQLDLSYIQCLNKVLRYIRY